MNLGDVFTRDGKSYIVSSVHRDNATHHTFYLATEMPAGETSDGLGRTFQAVRLHNADDLAKRGLVIPASDAVEQ